MSFGGLGNAANAMNAGPELAAIQTEALGFLSISGDAKVRLTSPWTPPPPPTASLMSIASKKQLVAAAGPDAFIISSTETVRDAFKATEHDDDSIRAFQPQLKIPLPFRISHLTFTADESLLILTAEQGGGLAFYELQALLQGSTEPAFQIDTNNESVRALTPNPAPDLADLCAVVTSQGKLLMADARKRSFVQTQNGAVLKEQVSCVAWSTKGKQLVAGLSDGTIHQMTPEGQLKAQISRPAELDPSYYVSSIAWLTNDLFLVFYVSTSGGIQESCHLITRQGQNFTSQKFERDPVDPFGAENPPHQSITRLKDFPPNLQDLLILTSTGCGDVGLVTRAKSSLASGSSDPSKSVDVFTTTELEDDSRRATLPIFGGDLDSRPPIGVGLDLSSKENVYKPIPSDEMEQSPGPLPGYWVLNDQGVLSAWWVVYSDSVRGGTTFPGIAAADGVQAPAPALAAPQAAASSSFDDSAAKSTPFGSSAAPSFGSATTLGANSSPWSAKPASTSATALGSGAASSAPKFGAPSMPGPASSAPKFGAPSLPGAPSFGQPGGGLGASSSPWASNSAKPNPFASGSAPTNTSGPANPFSSSASSNNATSSGAGFASFASQSGFGSLGSNTTSSGTNIFASKKSDAPEVSMDSGSSTMFPPSTSKPASSNPNPFGSQKFQIKSSFEADPKNKDEDDAPATKPLFGSNFGSALGDTAKPNPFATAKPNPFAPASNTDLGQPPAPSGDESTTPTTTPAPSRFLSQAPAAPQSGGLFSLPSKVSNTPGNLFGSSYKADSTPNIKVEAESPKRLEDIQAIPLPPESTSKNSYPLGESSSSSATTADSSEPSKAAPSKAEKSPLPPDSPPAAPVDDTPLPPDPVKNKAIYNVKFDPIPGVDAAAKPKPDAAPLPPDPVKNKSAYDIDFKKPPPGSVSSIFGSKPTNSVSQSTTQPKTTSLFPSLSSAKSTPASSSIFGTGSVLPTSSIGQGFLFPTNPPPVPSDSDDDDFSEGDEDEEEEQADAEQADEEQADEEQADEANEGASEGSGVDVAKDLSPSTTEAKDKTPGYTPQSSFDGLTGSFSTISRPDQGRSYFGEISRGAPVLPQPNPVSPRSPSPVRNALPGRMMGNDQHRSFSTPAKLAPQLLASQGPSGFGNSIVAKKFGPVEDQIMEQKRRMDAKTQAEESRVLVDDEEEQMQAMLNREIEPSKTLHDFVAHYDVAPPASDNIPAQVEAVYRDINSMMVTLGLNHRSLEAFIRGQKYYGEDERTRHDLASDDWTLNEIPLLSHIIDNDLAIELDRAMIKDEEKKAKIGLISELQRELLRDRNKQADLKKAIAARLDSDSAATNRSLPLSTEQATQQTDLRREYAKFAKLLAAAEENLTLLKAKIVSANGSSGKGGPTPTIEAVVRTITKMTSMVEKRSGDIDVLENQMRKLRLSSAGPGSREGSPFTTPNAKRNSLSSSLILSPERSMRESTPHRSIMRHSLSGSVGSGTPFRSPPKKKLSGFGDIEKVAVKEKRDRRAAVLGKLRTSLAKKEVVVVPIEQDA